MDSLSQKKMHISAALENNTATLHLGGQFTFSAHRDFKAAYMRQLENEKIGNIIINMEHIDYLDSAALGMLLVLRDQVSKASKSLFLSKPSPVSARTFDIAGFDKLFSINH